MLSKNFFFQKKIFEKKFLNSDLFKYNQNYHGTNGPPFTCLEVPPVMLNLAQTRNSKRRKQLTAL